MADGMITANNPQDWSQALQGLAEDEPYYQLGYHQAFAADTGAKSLLYRFDDGGERLIHPILLRPIPKVGSEAPPCDGLTDIESVYGFSGPLATTRDPAFLRAAWSAYRDWCKAQGVVSEFIRFHPFMDSQAYADPTMTVVEDRQTVQVMLSNSGNPGDMANFGATAEHRNRLRKAERTGLRCHQADVTAENLSTFQALYRTTMTHLGATEFYFFSDRHLERLVSGLPDKVALFFVTKEDQPIAGALFMLSATRLYYHLGGSLPEYRKDAPNNLLFQSVIDWGAALGLNSLFMGGGRTNADDDALLRFKRKLQADRSAEITFRFGKQIYDRAAYRALGEIWSAQSKTEQPAMLQFYRLDPGA